MWAEKIILYDYLGNINSTRNFTHNKWSVDTPNPSSSNPDKGWVDPGFFKFGNISGFDTERFCGEVWDDSGVKLRDKACNQYNPPINTWTNVSLSGKCPAEDYCLWQGPGVLPLSDGEPLPPASDADFWSGVYCVPPGGNVTAFFDGKAVELTCLGKVYDGKEYIDNGLGFYDYVGPDRWVNAWCPVYGSAGPVWLQSGVFPGHCAPAQETCDSGTDSSLPVFHVGGRAVNQLVCDDSFDVLLDGGLLAETCFDTNDPVDNGSVFPKISVCCPLVSIPVIADEGDTDFNIYEFGSVKIY